MSIGWIIVLIIVGFVVTGGLLAWILFRVFKQVDKATDKIQYRANGIENWFVRAGCEGWIVELLASVTVGDEEEFARLMKAFIESKNTEEFFVENVCRPCGESALVYPAPKHNTATPTRRRTTPTTKKK